MGLPSMKSAIMRLSVPFSLSLFQSSSRPRMSSGHVSVLSLWVVIMFSAPMMSAIMRVYSLAPPMWPERTDMANLPVESMLMTAGSVVLEWRSGAMVRTQMPRAPMKMRYL